MENQLNISPIKMIRLVKNLSCEEMADVFNITKDNYDLVENSNYNIDTKKLIRGLNLLQINISDYLLLIEFSQHLDNSELSELNKYKYMLIESLEIMTPERQYICEDQLNSYFYNKSKLK